MQFFPYAFCHPLPADAESFGYIYLTHPRENLQGFFTLNEALN
jgi:hypothetical protein